MKVRFNGQSDPIGLLNGKIYNVESIEYGWYRIVDETNENYLYPAQEFEIVEKEAAPPITETDVIPV